MKPSLEYQRTIVGYHGCDQRTAVAVLKHEEHLEPSDNDYDWLGTGIYFWEYGPRRALEFAREKKKRGELDTPAVLGAHINLGRCFDLADIEHTRELGDAYERFSKVVRAQDREMPENEKAKVGDSDLLLRYLDCAVMNFYMSQMDSAVDPDYHYQTVRGVFQEGSGAYPGAKIREKSHVQVAVRDPECVLGYFLPSTFFDEVSRDEQ